MFRKGVIMLDEEEIDNNLCDEDALAFNFDMPMMNEDITSQNILITTK